MSLFSEFKAFAIKGNVIDLAVAVIIGAAFGRIVSSFVDDIIMPPLGMLLGGVDFKDLAVVLREGYLNEQGLEVAAVTISYGNFIQNVVDFIIIAFAIFMAIHAINLSKRKKEVEAAAPVVQPQSEVLLEEIRDILKTNSRS